MVFIIFSVDNKSDVKSINTARRKQTKQNKAVAGTLGAVQVPTQQSAPNKIILCLFG